MKNQPKIIIVGGSLVGPAGALFLRNQGYTDVTVLEANPHPYNQSGGVMGVRQPTLNMLAEIGIHETDVIALTDPRVFAFDVNGTEQPALRGVSEFPGKVSSWDALHFELGRRVNVRLGHAVTQTYFVDGRQVLTCSCGEEHDADVVLWADGRRSTGRTLLDPHRTLNYNGYVVWRGLVTPPDDTPHGFHRYYDIEGGRLFSLTEPVVQSGRSYWEFSHNLPANEWQRLTGKTPEQRAYMLPHQVTDEARAVIRRAAVGMPHRFEEIIEHSEVSGIPVNDITLPTRAIHTNPNGGMSVLFGDALVPVRLQVGAGLNQGLHQIHDFVAAFAADEKYGFDCWEYETLAELARWVEQGRSRAHRNNLGWYIPVRKGKTTAPIEDQWADPHWVTA